MNSQLNSLVLRLSSYEDAQSLRLLAQLDSQHEPSGAALMAEVDGDVLAAVPLDGGPAIADPFRRTADIVSLLQTRAAQVRAAR